MTGYNMYVDELSAERINSDIEKVILVGNYFGTSNFEEIL